MNRNYVFKNSMYYLKFIMKFDRIRIPGVVISTLLNAFDAWFLKVFILKLIVDVLMTSLEFQHVLRIIVIAIGFKIIKLFYDTCWAYYIKHSDQRIVAGFQHIVFSKAAEVDLQCYDNPEYYNNYVYSVQDSSQRPLAFIKSISQLLQTFFTMSFSGIYVIFYEPALLLFSLIPILGDSFIRTKMNKVRADRTSLIIPESRKIDYIKRVSYLKENAIDIRVTKINLVLMKIFQKGVDSIVSIYKKYSNKFISMYFLSDLLTHLNSTLVTLVLVYRIIVLETLTAGDFIAIREAISLVSSNLGKIMERVQAFHEHSIYIHRFKSFSEYINKVIYGNSTFPEPKDSILELNVKQLSFAYNKEMEVLNQINISINRGEFIGIVGLNGAGKSTLIKLLLHMYDPNSGSVEFRGKDIKMLAKDDYLSEFDTVFQEHNSYAFTFIENITFEDEFSEYKKEKIQVALQTLDFEDFLPYAEEDFILTKEFDEKGIVLSGGQNQKIALARALYRDKEILILDEPTSALDPIAEDNLMKKLKEIAENRTVIMISHRLSSIRDADCIYLMEKGKIMESGTHSELMRQQGKYFEMFMTQADAYQN